MARTCETCDTRIGGNGQRFCPECRATRGASKRAFAAKSTTGTKPRPLPGASYSHAHIQGLHSARFAQAVSRILNDPDVVLAIPERRRPDVVPETKTGMVWDGVRWVRVE